MGELRHHTGVSIRHAGDVAIRATDRVDVVFALGGDERRVHFADVEAASGGRGKPKEAQGAVNVGEDLGEHNGQNPDLPRLF